MKIFLVRHGDTKKVESDTILSKEGFRQAKRVAKRLKNFKIDRVFVSNLTRAKLTMEEYKKVNPKIKVDISEDLNEIYRAILGGPEKEGTSPGREDKDKERANRFFDSLLKSKEENIVVFAHGNIIKYFIARTLNKDPKGFWESSLISNGSISIIEKNETVLRVKAINIIDHLDREDIKDFYEGEIKNENYVA